jgi:hypothetical protein
MDTTTHPQSRLTVIYDAAAGPGVYRIAVEIAARAWDAGCGVRIRRFGGLIEPDTTALHGDWLATIDAVEIPELRPVDLEWATVALVLSAPRSGQPSRVASCLLRGSSRRGLS